MAEPVAELPTLRARARDAGRVLTVGEEVQRKALHLLFTSVPVMYALGMPQLVLLRVIAALTLVSLAVEVARSRFSWFRYRFEWAAGLLLRPAERLAFSGATWLLLAFTAALALLPRDVAVVALWAVSAGDAAAALVGRSIGRVHAGRSPKTLEGSLACVLVVAAGAVLLTGASWLPAVVLGVAAAASEWPRGPLNDNVRVAGVVALVAALIGQFP